MTIFGSPVRMVFQESQLISLDVLGRLLRLHLVGNLDVGAGSHDKDGSDELLHGPLIPVSGLRVCCSPL